MPNKFHIDQFEPKHLKRANTRIDHHLTEMEKNRIHCKEEIKELLKEPGLWEKTKKIFRTYF